MDLTQPDETIESAALSIEGREFAAATSREDYLKRVGIALLKISDSRWQKSLTADREKLLSNTGDDAKFASPQQQHRDTNLHPAGSSADQRFDWKGWPFQIEGPNPPVTDMDMAQERGCNIPGNENVSDQQECLTQPFTVDTANKCTGGEHVDGVIRDRVDDDLQRKSNEMWMEIERMQQKYKQSFRILYRLLRKNNAKLAGIDAGFIHTGFKFCSRVLCLKRESKELSTWDSQSIRRIEGRINRFFRTLEPGFRDLVRCLPIHSVNKRTILAHLMICSGGKDRAVGQNSLTNWKCEMPPV